jgi:predicted nucleotidyltransferase
MALHVSCRGSILPTGERVYHRLMDLRTAKTPSPREFHARRRASRLSAREALREQKLGEARAAIRRLAPRYPAVRRVYLFGSLLRPGRFHEASDIDVALECDDLEVETPFGRALEEELHTAVDLRPFKGAIVEAVRDGGERVYG